MALFPLAPTAIPMLVALRWATSDLMGQVFFQLLDSLKIVVSLVQGSQDIKL